MNGNQYQINDMNKQVIFTTNSLQDLTHRTAYSSDSSASSSATSTNQNNNLEMDWTDPSILQFCEDLNDHDNFMSINQTNSNLNDNFVLDLNSHNQQSFITNHSRTGDPLINANDGNILQWDLIEPDYNQLMQRY